jgi:hypothetical protein
MKRAARGARLRFSAPREERRPAGIVRWLSERPRWCQPSRAVTGPARLHSGGPLFQQPPRTRVHRRCVVSVTVWQAREPGAAWD